MMKTIQSKFFFSFLIFIACLKALGIFFLFYSFLFSYLPILQQRAIDLGKSFNAFLLSRVSTAILRC